MAEASMPSKVRIQFSRRMRRFSESFLWWRASVATSRSSMAYSLAGSQSRICSARLSASA
jgi:hypothetical protein